MVDKINPKYLDAFTKASRQSSPATGDVLLLQRGNTNQHVLFQDLKAAIVDDPATTDGSIQELVESTTDGVSTTFSFVDTTPTSANNVFAFVDGRLDRTVTVDGKNVTFDSAPPSGEALVLIHWQTAGGGGGGGGVTDHGDLTGLSDDDHTQYALADGTRPFTGNLDVGGNSITNVVQVDGRNLETDGAKLDTVDESADVNPTAVSGAEITAGTGTTIRGYTPANIVSFISTHASGGGDMLAATYDPGGTADDVFDMANMSEATNQKILTAAERTKLSGIETAATADQSDSEIETAYNNRVAVASQVEMEAGTSTSVRRMTPQRVYQAIDEFTYLTAEIDALTWAADDIVSGTFADALIAETNVTQHEAAIDHDALSGFVADEHIDWTSTTENLSTSGTAATGALTVTGNIAVSGTVDGRDVASDGTKLDGIEASADVTDTANVTAAGALMDSEVTNLADVKAFDPTDYATAGSSVYTDSVATIAALKARDISGDSAGFRIRVDEHTSGKGVGGGDFLVIDSASESDDGGVVIEPTVASGNKKYKRWNVPPGYADVTWFGAVGDGSTDDLAAFQSACDYLKASADRGSGSGFGKWIGDRVLHIPPAEATYRFTSGHLNISSQIVNINVGGGGMIETTATDDCIFRFYSDDPGTSEYPAYLHRTVSVQNLTLRYSGGGSTNADAKHIIFDSNGESGSLFGPALINNVTFNGGRRAVSEAADTDGFMTNLTVMNCLFQGGKGAFVSIDTTGSSTGCLIFNNQTSISDPVEATIICHFAQDLDIMSNAWEAAATDDTKRSAYFDFQDSQNITVIGDRMEWGFLQDAEPVFKVSNSNTTLTIRDFTMTNCLVKAGETATFVQSNTGSATVIVDGGLTIDKLDVNSTGRFNLCNNVAGTIMWKPTFRFMNVEGGTANHYLHADSADDISTEPGAFEDFWFGAEAVGTADGYYALDVLDTKTIPTALPQPTLPSTSEIVMKRDGWITEVHTWKEDVEITTGGYTAQTLINDSQVGDAVPRTGADGDTFYEARTRQPIEHDNATFKAGDTLKVRIQKFSSASPNTMDFTVQVRVFYNG